MSRWGIMWRLSHSMKRRRRSRAIRGSDSEDIARVYARMGRVREARQMLKRLGDRSADVYVPLATRMQPFGCCSRALTNASAGRSSSRRILCSTAFIQIHAGRTPPPHELSDRHRSTRFPLAILCTIVGGAKKLGLPRQRQAPRRSPSICCRQDAIRFQLAPVWSTT